MRKFFILLLFFFFQTNASAAGLTLDFQDLELKAALQSLARLGHQELLLDDSVQGKITLHLENTDFQTALNSIATAKGLSYRTQNQLLIISSRTQLQKNDLPLHTLPLDYLNALEAAELLKNIFPNSLWADYQNNQLIFAGDNQALNRLKILLKNLDKPAPQVHLEAKIIALSEEASKSLGVRWGWDTLPQHGESSSDDDNYGGNFNFWRGNSLRFNATINALIANGKAKIVAKPGILTLPGKEASIFIGDHIPVQTEKRDSNGSYTSTEYVDAGIKLKYTPVISQDQKYITAKVHTEVATASLISELTNYKITSRTADTQVRLQNCETLVIGGLINEEEQRNLQKVPFLGDLPLLGSLFRSHNTRKSKVEVIMLLTPEITVN